MNRLSNSALASCAAVAFALSAGASADDWNLLGLYAGAGVGESTVRSDYGFDPDYPVDSHPHHTAWKAIVGIRPIPFLGAEAEYIDFGHPDSADSTYVDGRYYGLNADSHPKAGVLYGVGYVPLPTLPAFDLFGKVGVARLETNLNNYNQTCNESGASEFCATPVLTRYGAWQTKVAYGAGAQVHFFGLAVRAEYERINSTYGDPDAYTISATWTF